MLVGFFMFMFLLFGRVVDQKKTSWNLMGPKGDRLESQGPLVTSSPSANRRVSGMPTASWIWLNQ